MAYNFETFEQKAKRLGYPSVEAMIEAAFSEGGNYHAAAAFLDCYHSSLREWIERNGYRLVIHRNATLRKVDPLERAS